MSYYEAHPPKGEFVLVVEGAPPVAEQAPTLEDGLALVDKLQLEAGPPGTRSKRRQQPAGSPGKCSMTVCLPERKNLNLDDSGRSACGGCGRLETPTSPWGWGGGRNKGKAVSPHRGHGLVGWKERGYFCNSSLRQCAQIFLPLKTEISFALSQKMQAG